jgi:hypothetical protein
MSDYDEDDSEDHDNGNGSDYSAAVDPHTLGLMIAVTWCRVANNKTLERAIKKLDRLNAQYADIQAKCAALTVHAEQTKAALDARAAELDAREAAITKREDEFAASIEEARDHLRGYYNSIAEEDRRIRYRILSFANLLHGYNAQLQDLPDWRQIKQLVPDLPPDPPAPAAAPVMPIDALSDTFADPHADRHGQAFLGSLSRSIEHKRSAS